MKAAVLREFGQPLELEDVPDPSPGPDEVVIKVKACGIDGTDVKLLEGFGYRPELPFITGHEPAGVVQELGEAVTEVQRGDRVVVYNFTTCGVCELCRANRANLCPNMTAVLGVRNRPGGHAELLVVPSRQLVTIPDQIPWTDAAVLGDAGITAFHAIDRAQLKLGETILIVGVGGVGSYAVQFAKLAGARVITVDVTEEKVQRSLLLGADKAINATQVDVVDQVREFTDNWGVDCAIDIVGTQSTIGTGVDSLRNGGRIVIVGYTPEEYPVSGKRMAQNELQLIGSRCGRQQDLIDVVRLVAQGRTQSIVTDLLPLGRINEALDLLRAGKVLGRVVLQTE